MQSILERYTNAFLALVRRHQDVTVALRVAELGLPAATSALHVETMESLTRLKDGRAFAAAGDPDEVLAISGGLKAVADLATANHVETYRASVQASALVFMHGIVDSLLSDLCSIAADASPEDWAQFIGNAQVTIAEVKTSTYEALRDQKLASHVQSLSRDTLRKRSDRLLGVCRPGPNYSPLANDFALDVQRMTRLDALRQQIVHGMQPLLVIMRGVDVNAEIEHLLNVGLYHWSLLNVRYDLKVDPRILFGDSPLPAR